MINDQKLKLKKKTTTTKKDDRQLNKPNSQRNKTVSKTFNLNLIVGGW